MGLHFCYHAIMRGVCLFLWLTIALLPPANPPIAAAQLIEGLVNLKFQLDPRAFAVMATINAAGFDLDSQNLENNPTRKLARERLSRLDPDLLERLRKFYFAHDVELDPVRQQSKYLSLALALTGPPEFALSVKPSDVPTEAQSLLGFESLLRETWEKGGLAGLWDATRPFYLREVEIYRPLIRGTILECLRYLRTEARVALDRQVIFSPDLLNGYGIVNARNIGDNYYLLVGPSRLSPRPAKGIRHEYLHFMIDPLMAKFAGNLPEPDPFLSLIGQRPRLQPHLAKNFALAVTESLISVVEQRLESKAKDEAQLQLIDQYDQGLIFAPYFDAALEKFEHGQESLYEFFPTLLKGIQLEQEKRRPEAMVRLRSEIDDRRAGARAIADAEATAKAELRGLLVRANEHLLANRFDEARDLLEKVLKQAPANASALYGMAQIAGRDQNLELALSLYARAAENAGDERWIAGWSHIRRGNIYEFLGDLASARKEWSKVQELQGDLRGAREAASKALSRN